MDTLDDILMQEEIQSDFTECILASEDTVEDILFGVDTLDEMITGSYVETSVAEFATDTDIDDIDLADVGNDDEFEGLIDDEEDLP